MADNVEIVFDPIFGPQATRVFVKKAKKTGERAGKKLSDGVTKKTDLTKAGRKGARTFSRSFSAKLDVAIGNIISDAVSLGLREVGAAVRDSVDSLRGFSRGIAEINSILPANEKLTKKSIAALINFSNEFGTSPQTQAQAFYNVVSSGVKTTAKQLRTLGVANKAATAGLVDIDSAAKLLVSSVNAYSQSGLTATEASDALFVSVREGQVTFSELAAFMGKTTGLAAAIGLEFSELTGAIAAFTKTGLLPSDAIVGLRQILVTLAKPSKEAAKEAKKLEIVFTSAALKAKGFAVFLKEIGTAIDGPKGSNDSIAKLFGNVRALTPIMTTLNGNFKKFKDALDQAKNSIGSTDLALAELKKSLDFKLTQRIQQFKNFFLIIAQGFSEVFLPALLNSEAKFSDLALSAIRTARDITAVFVPIAEIIFNVARVTTRAFITMQRALITGFAQAFSVIATLFADKFLPLLESLEDIPGLDRVFNVKGLRENLEAAKVSIDKFAEESSMALTESFSVLSENITGVFDFEGTEKVNIFFDNIENRVLLLKTAIDNGKPFDGLLEGLKKALAGVDGVIDKTAKKTLDLAGAIAGGISQGIQGLVSLAAFGEGSVKSLGKAILGTIGELAIQLGTFFIASGIAKSALVGLPGSQVIAAGVGLIALGSVLKGFAGGAGGIGGSVGSPATAGGGGFSTTEPVDSESTSVAEIEEAPAQVNLTINGDVLDSAETGMRIVDILNDAFDTGGAVIRNPSFV